MDCGVDSASVAGGIPKVAVRADGTALIDGEPFFPFGFYHIPFGASANQEMNTLKEIHAAGFNLLYAAVTEDVEAHERLLDEADKLEMRAISADVSGRDTIEIINRLKSKPALIGWRTVDDVDINKHGRVFNAKQVLKLHCQYKKADPDHLTYISGSNHKRISEFVNTADAVGVQAYPIGYEPLWHREQPLSWSNYITSIAHRSAPKNRLIIANTQAYGWEHEDSPVPTYLEVRNLTYQALLAGAKGIIYYAYKDGDWNIREHPELWTGMKSLVPEIKDITPLILNAELQPLKTGSKKVFAGIWTDKNKAMIIALSTDYDKKTEVSLPLPLKSLTQQQLASPDASSMTIADGKANLVLNPLEVKIYSFNL